MTLYTKLPELWDLFEKAIGIGRLNVVGDAGLVTLDSLPMLLNEYPYELEISYETFWETMRYFLIRANNKILSKKRK